MLGVCKGVAAVGCVRDSPCLCPCREEWRKGVFVSLAKFRSSKNRKDTLGQHAFFSFVTESAILLREISER